MEPKQIRADRRKSKYSGMLPSDMKRLRQIEEENATLKKLVPWAYYNKVKLDFSLGDTSKHRFFLIQCGRILGGTSNF